MRCQRDRENLRSRHAFILMKVRQLRFPDLGDVCKFSVSFCSSEVGVFLLHQSTDEADELCLPIGSGSQEYSFQMVTRSGIGDAHVLCGFL